MIGAGRPLYVMRPPEMAWLRSKKLLVTIHDSLKSGFRIAIISWQSRVTALAKLPCEVRIEVKVNSFAFKC